MYHILLAIPPHLPYHPYAEIPILPETDSLLPQTMPEIRKGTNDMDSCLEDDLLLNINEQDAFNEQIYEQQIIRK